MTHPLGTLVSMGAASIYICNATTGTKMLDIAVAAGFFRCVGPAIEWEEKINKKSRNDRSERHEHTSTPIHPQVIEWAKREGEAQGVDYQTIINEALLKIAR